MIENELKLKFHFTGDSVTDCGRRTDEDRHLGDGYVRMLSNEAKFQNMEVINTGWNGNRTRELYERWHRDVLSTDPHLISILVGINDTWRKFDSDDPTSTQEFEERYSQILTWSKEAGVSRIVICEPFVLPVRDEQLHWREDLEPKIAVTHRLAESFKTTLVRLDHELGVLALKEQASMIAPDGVHPTPYGHRLIANLWMREVFADTL